MNATLSCDVANTQDPVLHLLPTDSIASPSLLQDFRRRLQDTVWSHETPDTLMAPVWSAASSVAQFEARLQALYRAHLKVLHAVHTHTRRGEHGDRYVNLFSSVRRMHRWPVLDEGTPVPPDQLLSPEAVRWMFGRPDIVLGDAGPMVVETNFDTGIGGFEKPDDMWRIAAALFAPSADYLAFGGPLEGFARYFVDLAGDASCDVHWIMKNDAQIKRELTPVLDYLNGYSTRVRHSIHYAGERVPPIARDRTAWLHRACSIYSVKRDPERFAALLQQLMPAMRDCTVPLSLSVLESKLFLAWLSDPAARPANLSGEERAAADTLLPWTRVLSFLDERELDEVRHHHGDYILKKSDSYQAKEVYFGCNLTSAAWRALLEEKRMQPSWLDDSANIWLVQKRVRPRAYDLVEYTDTGIVQRHTGISCCPYLLGGKLRGLETWVMPFTPDLSMIHRMQFVPHFIRAGM